LLLNNKDNKEGIGWSKSFFSSFLLQPNKP
jgi:hypothetical protein